MLLQLAAALAPSLDEKATSLLYRSAKPLVLDDSAPQLQKRAYKVRCSYKNDTSRVDEAENNEHKRLYEAAKASVKG